MSQSGKRGHQPHYGRHLWKYKNLFKKHTRTLPKPDHVQTLNPGVHKIIRIYNMIIKLSIQKIYVHLPQPLRVHISS